jgi:hypothetical protein
MRKEGKPHGKPPPPPQSTMYVKKELTVSRKLCPSLQDDCAENGTSLSEGLGEDVCSLFC